MYGNRRVAGLRRSEVAMLAGVSVEYYTRLERGSLGGVSDAVLDALARALRLDDTERALQRISQPSANGFAHWYVPPPSCPWSWNRPAKNSQRLSRSPGFRVREEPDECPIETGHIP